MKTTRLTFIALLMLAVAACKNSNTVTPSPTETTTDVAADLAVSSLSTNSSGALTNVNDVMLSANVKIKKDTVCGTAWQDSVSRDIPFGNGYSYIYKANYSYTVNCTTNLFNGSVTSTGAYTETYNGPYIATSGSGSSDFTLSGLRNPAGVAVDGNYVVNGEYKRSGSFKSKVDTTYAGSHTTDIVFTNLTISKLLPTIKSGTATITISGTMPKKGSFNLSGTLVFNGGNTATLTLNGTVYTIDLLTGSKIRH